MSENKKRYSVKKDNIKKLKVFLSKIENTNEASNSLKQSSNIKNN